MRRLLAVAVVALAVPGAAAAQQGNTILFANGKSLFAANFARRYSSQSSGSMPKRWPPASVRSSGTAKR